ncbi:hypothetical protein D3C73_1297720 [compost metagenome]
MKKSVQLIQIAQQIFRTFVIDHPVLGQLNAAGGAMQQLGTQMILQRLDLSRYASLRQSEGVGRTRKTLQFCDAEEQLHCVNFIHLSALLLFPRKQ